VSKLPDPPSLSELAKIDPVERVIPRGTLIWRIYQRGGPFSTSWNSFRFFGPTNNRFDHHELPPSKQKRGILYGAIDGPTCFAEVFQESRVIDARRRDPWLVAFRLTAAITLLDMSGTWPTRAGASMAIHSGSRAKARKWSQAIYKAYSGIRGLWYCSSMNANKNAIALYERAKGSLPKSPVFHRALVDPSLAKMIQQAAAEFGYDCFS